MIKRIVGKMFLQLKNMIFLGGDDIDDGDSFIPKSTKKYDKILSMIVILNELTHFYKTQLEIENGEVIQLNGFSSVKDSMKNKIGLTEIELFGFFPRFLLKYIRRIGTWLILFTALGGYIYAVLSDYLLQSVYSYSLQELFQIYLIPMFISIIIFFLREVIFEYQKKRNDQQQNTLQCMKFKSLKKCYQRVKTYNETIMNQINLINKESSQNNNYPLIDKRQSNADVNQIHGSQGQADKNNSAEKNGESYNISSNQQDNFQYSSNNKYNNILNNISNNNQIPISPNSQTFNNNNNQFQNSQNTAIFPLSNHNSFISNGNGQNNPNNNINNNAPSQIQSNQQSFTNINFPVGNLIKQASEVIPVNKQGGNFNTIQNQNSTKNNSNYQIPSQKQIIQNSVLPTTNRQKKQKQNKDLAQSINLVNGGAFLSGRRAQNGNNNSQQNNITRKKSIYDRKIDEQALEEKLQKYNCEKIQIVETVQWQDLQIGDIVILKRGQVAPADLLILENKGGRCSVDSSKIRGICDEFIKKPTSVTSISDGSKIKQSVFEYRKILNGKIEYSQIKMKEGFKGFIKLSKDPKGEEIDNSNMIFRGSVLRNCKWVYGLVLFAGHDCVIYRQTKGMASLRKSFFTNKAQTFYTISLFQIILNIIISTLFLYFQPCNFQSNANYGMVDVQQYIVSYLMDYLNILPPLFYATMDIIEMINDLFQTWQFDYKKLSTPNDNLNKSNDSKKNDFSKQAENEKNGAKLEKENTYKLTKSISIADISLTNHVFFDKTGTITEDKFEVKSIFCKDQLFLLPDAQKIRTLLPNFEKEGNADKSIKNSSFEQANFPSEKTEERQEIPQLKPAQDSTNYKASITYLQSKKKKMQLRSETTLDDENIIEEEKDIIQSQQLIPDDQDAKKARNANRHPSSFFSSEDKHLKQQQNSLQTGDGTLFSPSNNGKGLENSHSMHVKRYSTQTESDIHINTSDEHIFLQNLFDEYDGYYHQAILSLVLCHQTNTHFQRNPDTKFDSIKRNSLFKIEKEILDFAEGLGYQFKWNNSSKGLQPTFHLKIGKKVKDYHILAVNEYTEKRKRMSVLIRDPNADSIDGAILIVRQAMGQSLPENIRNNQVENDKLIKNSRLMEGYGMRKVVYMKKELSEEQAMDYVQKYENAHKNLVSNTDQRDEIYNSIENDLELVCVIGLQEKIRPDVEPLIHNLNVCGIGTWMLSGDNFENNLAVSYQIGFVENDAQILHFSSEDPDLLKLQIRQQLQQFKNFLSEKKEKTSNIQEVQNNIKQLIQQNNGSQINITNGNQGNVNSPKEEKVSTPKSLNVSQNQFQRDLTHKGSFIENASNFNNQSNYYRRQSRKRSTSAWNQEKNIPQYAIFVSSKSLITIFSDNYLKDHFSFLSYFAKSVIGYDLSSQQKAWFVRLVKQSFPGNQKTLSVGDSYNDTHMMQETDISVQIQNSTKSETSQFGDIIIRDFKSLSRLVFLTSRFFSEIYEELLVYSFYRSFLLGYMLLFFNLIDCTYASSLFSGYDILNYNTIFFFLSIIPYIYKKYKQYIRYRDFESVEQIVDQFRYNIKVFKKKKTMLFLYKVVGHSFIEAFILFIVCYFYFNFGTTSDGKEYSLIVLKRMGLIMMTFWVQVKFNIANNQSFFEIIWSHLCHFLGVILYLAFGALINKDPSNYKEVQEMIESPQMYITIFGLCFFAIILQIFLENNMYIQNFFPFPYIIDKERYQEIKGEMNELKFNRQNTLEKNARNTRSETGILYYRLIIEGHLSKILNQIFKGSKQENMDQILQNLIQSEEISMSKQDMNKYTLKFKNRDIEKKYLEELVKQWDSFNKKAQISTLGFLEITLTIIASLQYQFIIDQETDQGNRFQKIVIPQSISVVVILILLVCLIAKSKKLFFQLNVGIFMFRILFKIIQDLVSFTNLMLISIIYSYNMNFAIFAKPHYILMASILQNIIFIPLMITQSSGKGDGSSVVVYTLICATNYILNFMFTLIFQKYTLEETERKNFLQQSKMQQEKEKVNNVLAILLPKFVRDRISDDESLSGDNQEAGKNQISEDQGDVAVLFLLICDFDEISQSENERIVVLLDNLFRHFDNLCQANDVTKIETVGNSYVCAAGLKSVEEQNSRKKTNTVNPVRRLINLAFDMKNYVQNIKWGAYGQSMIIKIGIHYGKVMAGVIGYHKPQFSLIGDTVNTTSRVMSTGENGKITVSKQAFDQIQNIFTPELGFTYTLKLVEAKGKGTLETFQIFQNKKNQQKQDKRRTQKNTLYNTFKKQTQYDSPLKKKQTIRQLSQNTQSPFRSNGRVNKYKSPQTPPKSNNEEERFDFAAGSKHSTKLKMSASDGGRQKNNNSQITQSIGKENDSNPSIAEDVQPKNNNMFLSNKKNSLNEIEEEASKASYKEGDTQSRNNDNMNNSQSPKKQVESSSPALLLQEELFIPLQNINNGKETNDVEYNEDDEIENLQKNSAENMQFDNVSNNPVKGINTNMNNQRTDQSYLIKPQDDDIRNKLTELEPTELIADTMNLENSQGRRRLKKNLTRIIGNQQQFQHSTSAERNEFMLKPESSRTNINMERQSLTHFPPRNSFRAINFKNGMASNRQSESKVEVGSEINVQSLHNLDQSAHQLVQRCNIAMVNDEIQDEYIEQDRLYDLYDQKEEKQTHENLISFKRRFFIPVLESDNPYVIQFNQQIYKESQNYRKHKFSSLFLQELINYELINYFIIEFIMSYFIKTLLTLFNMDLYIHFIAVVCVRASFLIAMSFFYIFRNKRFDQDMNLFKNYICILFIQGTFSVVFESYTFSMSHLNQDLKDQVWQLQAAEAFFIYSTFTSMNALRIELNIVLYVILLINWIVISNQSKVIIYIIYFFVYGGIAHSIFNYLFLQLQINNFNTYQILKKKNIQQASLLNNLLPLHILDKFFSNRLAEKISLTDSIDDVTILFADISQFTKYSSQVQPEQVVKMLRSLFYEFDRSVQFLNLFKLYTIGDCYVVLSFNDINKRNPVEEAKNIILMGLEMIRIIRNVRSIINFEELDMRIGVHTGHIIGGVIGTDIVRYDVYGKDVTIANKMESSGERGRILISQTTYDLLNNSQYANYFLFQKKEEVVHIKSVDTYMQAYFAELSQFSQQESSNILAE